VNGRPIEAGPRVQPEVQVTIEALVRQFIVREFRVNDPARLADDTLLMEEGIVDSVGMLAVIMFLESEFGIEVDNLEIMPENLESIARIASFVAGKQHAAGRAGAAQS
jgi:acyl carrier protein